MVAVPRRVGWKLIFWFFLRLRLKLSVLKGLVSILNANCLYLPVMYMNVFENWEVWFESNVVVIIGSGLVTKCFVCAAFLLIIVVFMFSNPNTWTTWILLKENSLHKMVCEIKAYDLITEKILKAYLLVTLSHWILAWFSVVLSANL